jgi:hypothetical protein
MGRILSVHSQSLLESYTSMHMLIDDTMCATSGSTCTNTRKSAPIPHSHTLIVIAPGCAEHVAQARRLNALLRRVQGKWPLQATIAACAQRHAQAHTHMRRRTSGLCLQMAPPHIACGFFQTRQCARHMRTPLRALLGHASTHPSVQGARQEWSASTCCVLCRHGAPVRYLVRALAWMPEGQQLLARFLVTPEEGSKRWHARRRRACIDADRDCLDTAGRQHRDDGAREARNVTLHVQVQYVCAQVVWATCWLPCPLAAPIPSCPPPTHQHQCTFSGHAQAIIQVMHQLQRELQQAAVVQLVLGIVRVRMPGNVAP